MGEQVGHDGAAGDRADRAEASQDSQLVEATDRAEVEERGPEAAAGEAQGRPGPGRGGTVVGAGPDGRRLR